MKRVYVIGTRGSVLALKQAEQAVGAMARLFPDLAFRIRKVNTEGQEARPSPSPGKDSFVKKLQESLLRGDIDVAVHSLKDMPVTENEGTEIAAFLKRDDPRDILVSASGRSLDDLPPHAVIGTSSLRRTLQLRLYRQDLRIRPLRGNVDTRLARVLRGEYDAAILAAAGMARLGMEGRIAQYLPIDRFIPSAGQGIVALEIRKGEGSLHALLGKLDNPLARMEAEAERLLIKELHADCNSPAGAHAAIRGRILTLRAMFAHHLEGEVVWGEIRGPCEQREDMARLLAHRMNEELRQPGRAGDGGMIPALRIWRGKSP